MAFQLPQINLFPAFGRGFAALLLLMMAYMPLRAEHIIGGVWTYTCLGYTNGDPASGSKTYRFTLKVYRDCQGDGADFDSANPNTFTAHVTVYLGTSTSPFEQIYLPAPVVLPVDPNPGNPCLEVPATVCVEEGIYEFELDLAVSPQSYTLVYQRCCRNATLSNIMDPTDSGATFSIELTAEAQNVCNSSPEFADFPPAAICANNDLSFDHSAIDAEGDSLVYSFCSPLLGGGPNITFPLNFDGLAPDPDAPPPYTPVPFIGPTYSATQPLGPLANLQLDPQTGLLTGKPVQLGQFVVGVCVDEYRNGVLLSSVRRDFQFNVTNCVQAVTADIDEDGVGANGELLIRSCGSNQVLLINRSEKKELINSYAWQIDLGGGNITTVNSENLDFTFPGIGSYPGLLIANPGSPGDCSDSAELVFNIFPEVTASIDLSYDSCVYTPIQFQSQVTAPAGGLMYEWNFGDGQTSTAAQPVYTYSTTGDMVIEFRVEDVNGCFDSLSRTISYYPLPEDPTQGLFPQQGCQPLLLTLPAMSAPVDSTYELLWDFGDGNVSSENGLQYIYTDAGTYDLGLFLESPNGCLLDTLLMDWVQVDESPMAAFSYDPSNPSNLEPLVRFSNETTGAQFFDWTFGNVGTSTARNPFFTFPDTGLYQVVLVAFNPTGCTDTVAQLLDVEPEVTFYVPNAFTPNSDGLNDEFKGKGVLFGIQNYQFRIWDRWGQEVFETTDPDQGWNGRKNNSGKLLPGGTYPYVISYTEPRGRQVVQKGQVVLIL